MENYKNKLGNNYLKMVVSFVIFLIAIVFILNNFGNNESPIINLSNQESKIDYRVKIFKNDFIKEEYMEKGKTYITDLVDDIEVSYNYKLTNSKKFDSEYLYNVSYKMTINHNSTGKQLWTEEETIVDNKNINPDKNIIEVQEKAIVDYDKINDKIKLFKLNYNIPIDCVLEINLNVIDSKSNEKIASTGLTTNLNTEIIDIEETEYNILKPEVENPEENNDISLVVAISIIVAILSLLYFTIETIRTIRYNLSRKSYYEKAVYKILKNYGDVVAELVSPVNLVNLNVIDVKNFDQMLDVEEELRIPIMFYETIKGKEGEFVIVSNEIAYRYILRDKMTK